MRYIIALLAQSPEIYIQAVQKFSCISQDYLLSKNSLPHITIAQFNLDTHHLEAQSQIEILWQKINLHVTSWPIPRFLGIGLTREFQNLGMFLLWLHET